MPAALREAPAFDVAGDEVDVDVRGDVRGDAPTDVSGRFEPALCCITLKRA
ncbi:MAG: hypothetical protein U1F25_11295 [Rubrivivax sp.]